mgnify:CR=1 FL=1
MDIVVKFRFHGVEPSSTCSDRITREIDEALENMRIAFDADECWIDSEQETTLEAYIADYIMEEQSRGNVAIDRWMVSDAIKAWKGGAGE